MRSPDEQISTEDLELLAGVMGWRRVDQFQTTQNGDFYVYLHEDTVRVLQDKVIEFDPTRDTDEGREQAKRLVKALCRSKGPAWAFRIAWDQKVYMVEIFMSGGRRPVYIEHTSESLAIVWAVLAAAKGAEDDQA